MKNPYKTCPVFENDTYLLRFVEITDVNDLLAVYSDEKSVPFFNSDNCGGDDFHYTTIDRMSEAIRYWLWEYQRHGFVRWTIYDKSIKKAIGTIELFHRTANDFYTDCGLLRLDLRSDYENVSCISEILTLILIPTFEMFSCRMIATKIVSAACERKAAFEAMGFSAQAEFLVGHDGTHYTDYYILSKNRDVEAPSPTET